MSEMWTEISLGELGTFLRGRGGPRSDDDPQGVPCVRYGDLYTHHDSIIRSFSTFIAPDRKHTYSRLAQGDIIFAGSGETHEEIGKAAALCTDIEAYAGGDTIIFRPGPTLDPCFVGYAVNSVAVNQHKARMGQGSSVIHISAENLSRLRFLHPRRQAQHRIAEILSTVDEAIEQTEALIAKTQQIKAGLMHDLFTRGVTPNGELRPPREEAPHLYRESPIGWIPKEWEAPQLEELATLIIDGTHFTPTYVESGVPFLRVTDIQDRQIDRTRVKFIAQEEHEFLCRRCSPQIGDILLSKNGSIGLTKVVDWSWEFSIFVSLCLIRPIALLRADFLAALFSTEYVWLQIRERSKQGTVTNLHLEEIRELCIPLPPSIEQNLISDKLRAIEDTLIAEEGTLSHLEKMKNGLMQDLLTGRVRVHTNSSTDTEDADV